MNLISGIFVSIKALEAARGSRVDACRQFSRLLIEQQLLPNRCVASADSGEADKSTVTDGFFILLATPLNVPFNQNTSFSTSAFAAGELC